MARSVRSLTLSALMTALTAALSPLCIPIGPVSMTLQTFSAALTGYMLPTRAAFFSVCAYLLLGACGLPVFSGFAGGVGVLLGPTGGFLLGFPAMAFLCACGKRRLRAELPAGIAGLIVVYALGTVQLAAAAKMSLGQAILAGTAPFVLKDVLSIAGACWLGRKILARLNAQMGGWHE